MHKNSLKGYISKCWQWLSSKEGFGVLFFFLSWTFWFCTVNIYLSKFFWRKIEETACVTVGKPKIVLWTAGSRLAVSDCQVQQTRTDFTLQKDYQETKSRNTALAAPVENPAQPEISLQGIFGVSESPYSFPRKRKSSSGQGPWSHLPTAFRGSPSCFLTYHPGMWEQQVVK